jgi:alkylation response protein AidB-like acyl-CoA dehydrogenase
MDPFDSPSEAAFRQAALSWLNANARLPASPPIAASAIVAEWTPAEEEQKLFEARSWQQRKFDAGWAGVAWPQEYGGRGGSVVEQMIFTAEEAKFDVPHDALAVGTGWCGPAILVLGNEEQKRRYLPALLRGDQVWCQLFSEPGAGSDLASLTTSATKDGDEWLLEGQKVWTTFAHRADLGLCIARTDVAASNHQGLTAFVVDMGAEGVEARPLRQMTGASNFNEVFLSGVRVPDTDRLGEIGQGWRAVITTFMFERTSALVVGTTVADAFVELLKERAPAGSRERDRFVRTLVAGKALSYTQLRMLTALSQGRIPGPEGSIGKLVETLLLSDLYDQAVDLLGAAGLLSGADAPAEGDWLDGFLGSPGLRIGGGTDQIQRNILAERILGLPKDTRGH